MHLPFTLECSQVLKRVKVGYLIITAFPEFPALPHQHPGMAASLQLGYKEFWDRHVFLMVKQ